MRKPTNTRRIERLERAVLAMGRIAAELANRAGSEFQRDVAELNSALQEIRDDA